MDLNHDGTQSTITEEVVPAEAISPIISEKLAPQSSSSQRRPTGTDNFKSSLLQRAAEPRKPKTKQYSRYRPDVVELPQATEAELTADLYERWRQNPHLKV
jgi:hypothetical protein